MKPYPYTQADHDEMAEDALLRVDAANRLLRAEARAEAYRRAERASRLGRTPPQLAKPDDNAAARRGSSIAWRLIIAAAGVELLLIAIAINALVEWIGARG